MVSSGDAKGCTLTDLSSDKSTQWITADFPGNCKEERGFLSLTSLHTWAVSSRVPTRGRQSLLAGLRRWALLLRQAAARSRLEHSLKCAQQHPASTGAKPGSRLSHAALCSHLPTAVPTARGTGSSPQPHSAGTLEPGSTVLPGNSAKGRGKRGSNQTGLNYTCVLHFPTCRQQQHIKSLLPQSTTSMPSESQVFWEKGMGAGK